MAATTSPDECRKTLLKLSVSILKKKCKWLKISSQGGKAEIIEKIIAQINGQQSTKTPANIKSTKKAIKLKQTFSKSKPKPALKESCTSPSQQKHIIKNLHRSFYLKMEQKWYAINKKWYQKWLLYTMYDCDDEDICILYGIHTSEWINKTHPGPINNSMLLDDWNLICGYIHQIQQTFSFKSSFHLIPTVLKDLCFQYYTYPRLKNDIVQNKEYIWIQPEIWHMFILWFGAAPIIQPITIPNTSQQEKLIMTMRLVYFDDTGEVNYDNAFVQSFPKYYTIKDIVQKLEADIVTKEDTQTLRHIRLWTKLRQIENFYTVNAKVTVTKDDLKYEDPNRLVEIPDDVLCKKVNMNDVLVIERKQKNGTWPRSKGDNWRRNIKVGDIVDCIDEQNKWYESVVRYVYPKGHSKEGYMIIHYIGWRNKWDCELRINGYGVAKRNRKTKGPCRYRK